MLKSTRRRLRTIDTKNIKNYSKKISLNATLTDSLPIVKSSSSFI